MSTQLVNKIGTSPFDPHADLMSPSPSKKKVISLAQKPEMTVEGAERDVTEEMASPGMFTPPQQGVVIPNSETSQQNLQETAPSGVEQRKVKTVQKSPEKEAKVRMGANVPMSLKERVDNAAYWVPGLTVSQIVEDALEKEIKKIEKELNQGKPFEPMKQFKFGRPRAA